MTGHALFGALFSPDEECGALPAAVVDGPVEGVPERVVDELHVGAVANQVLHHLEALKWKGAFLLIP